VLTHTAAFWFVQSGDHPTSVSSSEHCAANDPKKKVSRCK